MNPISEHYFVFNATDGIEAHPESMAWNQATGFVEAFPKRCKKQGYHKTGFGERIPPEWAILLIVNNDNDVIARSYPTGPCRVALRHLAPWPLSMYFSCYPRGVHHGHYMAGLVIAEHDRERMAPTVTDTRR